MIQHPELNFIYHTSTNSKIQCFTLFPASKPEIMKAIILKGFGGVENLVITEIPVPNVSDNEVLVKVKAIGINPVDIKTRLGKGLAGRLKELNPIILGWDISGTVNETGRLVTSFKNGDEVFGMVNFPGHGKAYAEYVVAPETHLALKPANISHEDAAAASLAALTAWQILKEKAKIKSGDKVLIHAAGGGVGHYAVQMSKYLGAYIVGTASGMNKDFILSLGASEHIDYEKQRFEDVLNDIDFVLDTIGGEYIDRSLKVLKPGGTIISIPSGASENITEKAEAKSLYGYPFGVQSNGKNMNEISDLLQKGIVKSFISKTFTFDEIQSAHMQIETRKTKGKVVVTL
jgi:NADPH:quinone reductase-like Zn-dependent oxidoreductase